MNITISQAQGRVPVSVIQVDGKLDSQSYQDLIVKAREQGSSLDPSSETGTHFTTKLGFDLTKPLVAKGKTFDRAPFPEVDLKKFLDADERR